MKERPARRSHARHTGQTRSRHKRPVLAQLTRQANVVPGSLQLVLVSTNWPLTT
jgi:hypothetical protein